MKELTIEQKAQRYDEAIKKAQAKIEEAKVFDYDDEQTAHTIRLTTTDIFPELKESEDEIIIKALKSGFKMLEREYNLKGLGGIKFEKILAWLEKQGEKGTKGNEREFPNSEQKPAWSEEDDAVLDALIRHLEGEDIHVSPHLAVKCLKSLKDRYTWKPSERQKEALLWCVVHLGGADKQTLGELLEALNKL